MHRLFAALLFLSTLSVTAEPPIQMANGIKIGEVTDSSAIIWTRVTAPRIYPGTPAPASLSDADSESAEAINALEGAVPAASGFVQVRYWPTKEPKKGSKTDRALVTDNKNDSTHQFTLKNLAPNTEYTLAIEGSLPWDANNHPIMHGSFTTAPAANEVTPVSFMVVTGQDYSRRDDLENGHNIYPAMLTLEPSFFVHTGDIEYYDKPFPHATTLPLARFKWNRLYGLPNQLAFHNHVPSYFMKDDHDTLKNDSWPGQTYGDLTWEQGLSTFREQVPMGKKTYRTIRWGRDLQIWLVEGRDFRSPNNMPDGPNKTIWGKEQKTWFYESVEKSDATFRVLISPTPIVGPDRGRKNDNHANKGFTHEGDEIRSFIGKQKNMFVVCGDRHWQYVSVDPKTGVREFSCGPTSDKHANGFSEKNRSDMHRYLKIKGGFLQVATERKDKVPTITFRHRSTTGKVYNEDRHAAQ